MSSPKYGAAGAPMQPQYNGNPNSFNSFDRSQLANRAISNVQSGTGNNLRNAMAQATAMGGGRSAGNARLAQDVLAQGENRGADIQNNIAQQGWNDKIGQMGSLNNYNLGRYGTAANVYNTGVQADMGERKMRNDLLGKLGSVGDVLNILSM